MPFKVEAKGCCVSKVSVLFKTSSSLFSVTGSGELRRFKLNRMNNNKMFKFL